MGAPRFVLNRFWPSNLFLGGVPGAWYDPTDVNVNWRVNLLTYTEQFDNAAWSKVNVAVTPNATIAPDGTTTADRITAAAGASSKYVGSTPTASGQTAFSFYVKAGTHGIVQILNTGDAQAFANFDVTTGTIGSVGTKTTATIQNVGSGWFRCVATFSATTVYGAGWRLYQAPSLTSVYAPSWTTAGTETTDIWGAQLEVGSTATTYQQIVTPEITYAATQVTNLFQDSAGTTPVTAVEQPVGLILDKSANVAQQALPITGWAKTSGDGTVTVVGGTVTITGATTTTRVDIAAPGWSVGQVAYMTINSTVSGATSPFLYMGASAQTPTTGSRTYVARLESSTLLRLQVASGSATFDVTARGTYAGNHAYQTTSASRPVLRARYNRLTYSEQFDNAAWTKTTTTVAANSLASPDGTTTADTLTASGANATTLQSVTLSLGASYTFSVWIQRKTGTGNIDISADGVTYTTLAITSSWARYTVTQTLTSGAKTPGIRIATNGDAVYAWGAQLMSANDVAATGGAYQRIAAATVYDTAPIFRPYVEFDGVDDSWLTASINFTATDKMSLFAGVSRLKDTGTSILAELSADWSSNNGAFISTAPDAPNLYSIASRGTAAAAGGQIIGTASATYNAPNTAVITGTFDISGDSNVLRLNGASIGTATGDQGAGNFGNYPLYIGRRNNATLPLQGRLYEFLLRGAASSTTEIADTELWVNARTGAF